VRLIVGWVTVDRGRLVPAVTVWVWRRGLRARCTITGQHLGTRGMWRAARSWRP
jgi:hypothetical protein